MSTVYGGYQGTQSATSVKVLVRERLKEMNRYFDLVSTDVKIDWSRIENVWALVKKPDEPPKRFVVPYLGVMSTNRFDKICGLSRNDRGNFDIGMMAAVVFRGEVDVLTAERVFRALQDVRYGCVYRDKQQLAEIHRLVRGEKREKAKV